MPDPSDIKARIRALRQEEKKPTGLSISNICKTIAKGRNVFLVFDNNAERRKYQQKILQEITNYMSKEPVGGIPIGTFAGERVFSWDNGAEIAFSTDVPGDMKGNLFLEKKPVDTDVGRPEIPAEWKKN